MKDANRYHSRAWWDRRIKMLNDKNCTTVAQLQDTLNELVAAGRQSVREAIAARIVAGFNQLILSTPVDTGRAMSGWQIDTDPSVKDYVPPTFERATGKKDAKKDAPLPEYAALIRKAMSDMPHDLTEADVIYIVNNVEYILALEAGWSKQAPRGFIGIFLNDLRRDLTALARATEGTA